MFASGCLVSLSFFSLGFLLLLVVVVLVVDPSGRSPDDCRTACLAPSGRLGSQELKKIQMAMGHATPWRQVLNLKTCGTSTNFSKDPMVLVDFSCYLFGFFEVPTIFDSQPHFFEDLSEDIPALPLFTIDA